jgi:peptidoglycan/LPS O-acetylase OafA/YrhL
VDRLSYCQRRSALRAGPGRLPSLPELRATALSCMWGMGASLRQVRFKEWDRLAPTSARTAPNFAVSPTASLMLDLVRGLAAVAVFIGHFLNAFYVDYARIEDKSRTARALYSTAGFGLVAVVIFFVLSGFVIGASALRRHQENRFDWRSYFSDRITRLYLVLLPALLLGFVWDMAGMQLFGTAGIYGATFGDVITVPVESTTTLRAYFMNAMFMQKFFSEPAGSNSPLWSLSYEFWCYLALPLLLVPRRRLLAGCGVLAAYFLLQKSLGVFVIFWLCGVGVAFTIPLRKEEKPHLLLAGLSTALFVYTLAASRFLHSHVSYQAFIVAAGTSLFLFGLVRWWPREVPRFLTGWKTPAGILSAFSYTLYLTHYPLLVFLAAWFIERERWQPNTGSMFRGFAIFGVTMLYAYGVSRLTEAHTGKVRRWLSRRSFSLQLAVDRRPQTLERDGAMNSRSRE